MTHRWDLSVLIGPCSEDEAETMLEAIADFVNGLDDSQGAAFAMSRFDESAGEGAV